MPARKTYKHKKVYITRPIGKGGRTFRYLNTTRNSLYYGGGCGVDWPGKTANVAHTTWWLGDAQFKTPPLPTIVPPSSLADLIFETQHNDYNQALNGPSGGETFDSGEAKIPDMFRYRYVTPVHYGVSLRIIRCRTIFDSGNTPDWNPAVADLQNADLSWQMPVKLYWRADHSNLNNVFPFYYGYNSTDDSAVGDPQDKYYYVPASGTVMPEKMPSATPTATSTKGPANSGMAITDNLTKAIYNFHELLVGKRFAQCVSQPGSDCVMKYSANFGVMGLDGSMVDVSDLTYSSSNLKLPVSIWLRKFFSKTHVPGQAMHNTYPGIVGDLYFAPQMPETNPSYSMYYMYPNNNDKTEPSGGVSLPKARLCIEYEITTEVILRGQEYMPDVYKWGKDVPS